MKRHPFSGISEHHKAGRHRLDDAIALMHAVRWRGAMYMAGYSVECLLKSKLMRMYGCRHLSELEDELMGRSMLSVGESINTHKLEVLLRLSNGPSQARYKCIEGIQYRKHLGARLAL